MSKLTMVKKILDQYSDSELTNIFAPIAALFGTTSKTEMISPCLTKELGMYEINTYPSPVKYLKLDESVKVKATSTLVLK